LDSTEAFAVFGQLTQLDLYGNEKMTAQNLMQLTTLRQLHSTDVCDLCLAGSSFEETAAARHKFADIMCAQQPPSLQSSPLNLKPWTISKYSMRGTPW
jgi:hypothetical protein